MNLNNLGLTFNCDVTPLMSSGYHVSMGRLDFEFLDYTVGHLWLFAVPANFIPAE